MRIWCTDMSREFGISPNTQFSWIKAAVEYAFSLSGFAYSLEKKHGSSRRWGEEPRTADQLVPRGLRWSLSSSHKDSAQFPLSHYCAASQWSLTLDHSYTHLLHCVPFTPHPQHCFSSDPISFCLICHNSLFNWSPKSLPIYFSLPSLCFLCLHDNT